MAAASEAATSTTTGKSKPEKTIKMPEFSRTLSAEARAGKSHLLRIAQWGLGALFIGALLSALNQLLLKLEVDLPSWPLPLGGHIRIIAIAALVFYLITGFI